MFILFFCFDRYFLCFVFIIRRDDWQRDSVAAKPTTPPRFEQRMVSLFINERIVLFFVCMCHVNVGGILIYNFLERKILKKIKRNTY